MVQSQGLIEFVEWLVARKLADKTVQQYARHYKLFENELGEKELTQNFLNKFVIKHPSNISRSFLKNLFEYFDITDFKVPKIAGRRPVKNRKTISPKDLRRIREILYNRQKKYGLMCDLSFYCALRREEVISITLQDFDLQEYESDPSRPCKLIIHGKGARERPVIVPPKVMKRLINWLSTKPELPIEKKLFGVGKSTWHNVFKEAVAKTGSHNYTLHDLRRSRATIWHDRGVDVMSVRKRLGHSSVTTTQRYINEDEKEELKKWENEY